jgi:haloalkane dehalogenase
MTRREFMEGALAAAAVSGGMTKAGARSRHAIDVPAFHKMRRFAELPIGRIAYVEAGHGPVALFLHGFPLNGYQWRGALERLSPHRRCIAVDFMGLGYSEPLESTEITLTSQADMLAAFLDRLKVGKVDLVANDSGGLIAQVFVAHHGERVRSLLLTNCDVDTNSPPAAFTPLVQLAKRPGAAEKIIAPQLADKVLARSDKGVGIAYTHPAVLEDATIDCYFAPIVSSELRKEQFSRYLGAFAENVLVPIRPALAAFSSPARMVWGTADIFFGAEWATWLDKSLPGSRGVRLMEGAKLFFPEEMPEVIAEEARNLWNV